MTKGNMINSEISIRLRFPVEEIWKVVTYNDDVNWRSDLSKTICLDENNFIEYTKDGYPTFFEITEKVKHKKYSFNIKNTNMEGYWIGRFKELKKGLVVLEIEEHIKITNTIKRAFAKQYIRSQQKRYINDLKKKLNEKTMVK